MKIKFFPAALTALALLFLAACTKQAGSHKLPTPTPYNSPTPKPSPTAILQKPFTEVDLSKLSGTPVAGSDFIKLTSFSFQPLHFFITKNGLLVALGYESAGNEAKPLTVGTIDLATGKTKEYRLSFLPPGLSGSADSYYAYSLYPLGDNYLLTAFDSGDFYLLNTAFEKIDEYHENTDSYFCIYPLDETRILAWNDPVTDYIAFSSGAGGTLTADRCEFLLPKDTQLWEIQNLDTDGHAIVTAYDPSEDTPDDFCPQFYTALYDFHTGTLTRLPIPGTSAVYTLGDRLLLWDYKENTVAVYSRAEPDLKKSFAVPEGSLLYSISGDHTLWISASGGAPVLSRYSYETGSLLSSLTLLQSPDGSFPCCVDTFGETVFFTAADATDDNKSSLFCGVAAKAGQSADFSALLQTCSYAEENNRLTKTIEKQYGIPVFIRGDGVHYNKDYFMVAECDEYTIYQALTALCETLASFPKGFFTELLADAYSFHSIEIYLTADIRQTPEGENTLTTAGGFVTTADGIKTMTVDISDPGYKKTFAHEFMHIIEASMEEESFRSEEPDYDFFFRLSCMNPDGFEYFYSYRNYQGSKYAAYCGSNSVGDDPAKIPETIYFVDEYCLTYPGEDIARTFETLLFTPDNEVPSYIYSEPFQKKAAYVCACIRESFDCITEETKLPWERFLIEKLPLEYFKEDNHERSKSDTAD